MAPVQCTSSDEDAYGWQAYLEDKEEDVYGWQAYLDGVHPSAPKSSVSAGPIALPSSKGGGSSRFFSGVRPATTSIAGPGSSSASFGATAMRPYSALTSYNHGSYSGILINKDATHDHYREVQPPAPHPVFKRRNPIGAPQRMISPSLRQREQLRKERSKERKQLRLEKILQRMGTGLPKARPKTIQKNAHPPERERLSRMMGVGLPKARQEALKEEPHHPKEQQAPAPEESSEEEEGEEKEKAERIIFQAALKDLNQSTVEIDPPQGSLSVPLFRHQKMALAWMMEKEKGEGVCVGGILADDQGLGKTISMTALIQTQRSLQEEHKSGKSVFTAKLEPKVECDGDTEEISKRRRLTLEKGARGTSVIKPETLILVDDEEPKALSSGPVKLKLKVESLEVEEILRKTDFRCKLPAGTLVVCPASVVRQWARELDEKVTEEAKLSVLVYHGSKRTSDPLELARYDVVLTTYSLVAMEVPKKPLVGGCGGRFEKFVLSFNTNKRKKASDNGKGKKMKGKKGRYSDDSACGALAKVHWFRVILDEAHLIKNHQTKVARACCSLRAKSRWCLSGTPIQNEIEELYSYFRFLRHDPYSNYTKFLGLKGLVEVNNEHGYKRIRCVLKAIMLRRTKGTQIGGKPILNLPPKTTHLTSVDFSDEERAFYDALERKYRRQFMAYAAQGTIFKHYATILLMLLRLRQICDHSILVINGSKYGEESLEIAKSFPRGKLQSLLGTLENSRAICSVCSDQPQNAVVTTCGHVCCYQCGLDYLTDEATACPETGCEEEIYADALFTEEILQMCLSNDLDSDYSSSFGRSEELTGLKNGSSSKIKATLEILESFCIPSIPKPGNWFLGCSQDSEPKKTIVFSQWTGMLDLVEDKLRNTSLQYRRLDGSMTLVARDMAVKDFNTRSEVTVMLMSLKAGNLGLNMVAACHVILLDPWWNPTTEDQAVDRAHRIGQTRPVTVTRLTIANTVEDRILALQQKKRQMVSSVLGEDQGAAAANRLTVDDLKSLFNVRCETTFHHGHDGLEE